MKDAPLVRLARAPFHRPGLDITVKSAQGLARAFAPTWDMVMGHKRGTLSDTDYTAQYHAILDRVPVETWRWLYDQGRANGDQLTVRCYCPDGVFCHTHLLIAYACYHYPKAFTEG